jgi:putative endonuclease
MHRLDETPDDDTMWYVYVLLCEDGSLYKGFTTKLKQRYAQHLAGHGAKHTKNHKPVKVAYYEICDTEQDAVKREKYLKSGVGREFLKEKIMGGSNGL